MNVTDYPIDGKKIKYLGPPMVTLIVNLLKLLKVSFSKIL